MLDEVSISIRAYQQFQDILGIVEQKDIDIINRHYCYYESQNYLRESAISWLDKNILSSITLLRPFMELSLLHIYWHLKCEYNSYSIYYEWLEGNCGKPTFKNLLDSIFKLIELPEGADLSRIQFLKEVLIKNYEFLCTYNHTPKIEESLTTIGQSGNSTSPDAYSIYPVQLQILLKQLVYLYVLVYPYSLYPFNQVDYLGYDKTVHIFFDDINYKIVKKYIGSENIQKLKKIFDSDYRIKHHKKKISSLEPLSKDDLAESWERFKKSSHIKNYGVDELEKRYVYHKSHSRSINFAINYIYEKTSFADIPEEYFDNLENKIHNW